MTDEEAAKALGLSSKPPVAKTKQLTDEEKEQRTQAFLDRELGEGDEKVYAEILKVARGEVSMEVLTRAGDPATKRPSFSDRLQAWGMLLDRHRGRPVQKHQHDLKPPADTKWDPDKLELEDLRQMRRLAEKGTVVEGTFTEDKDKTK